MSTEIPAELTALAEQWRRSARRFMAEAERTRGRKDMVRLTAIASTLEWVAADLTWLLKCPRIAALLTSTGTEAAGGKSSE
jgi:hypothetical protein